MKRFSFLIITLLTATLTWAVPARRIYKTLTLADGTTIANALFSGDESFHFWLAPDGQKYQETNGVAHLLTQETIQGGIARKAARRQAQTRRTPPFMAAKANNSTTPAPRGLVILVNFSNEEMLAANGQAQFNDMLNGTNYTHNQSIGSARKYFQDQSNGAYNPQFDVVGPVTLPHPIAFYGANDADGNDLRIADFVLDACSIASKIPGVDMANYDTNNDQIVDFVYLIYAGYGEADTNIIEKIWPCSWDVFSAVAYGYSSLPPSAIDDRQHFTFDNKIVYKFACSSELDYRGQRAGIGTFCHEFSHVLGLPDYYDTEYGYNSDYYYTPGGWSLMDHGSYNVDGQVPPNYSIYDKFFLGWATPMVLWSPCNVTLPADNQTGFYINASCTIAQPTSTATTYYIENRQLSGWDQGLPGHGMLVWNVKYDQTAWDNNYLNNTDKKPCLTIYSASGLKSGIGTKKDPYPGSYNVRSLTPITGYPITDIAENNSVITFKFKGGGPDISGNDSSETAQCDNYAWSASSVLSTTTDYLGDYLWSFNHTGTYTSFDATKGAQFGSRRHPSTALSLTTNDPSNCLIGNIVVNASKADEGNSSLSVFIGGKQIGKTVELTSTPTNYTFINTNEAKGYVEIRYTNSLCAFYLKAINIYYQTGSTSLDSNSHDQPIIGIYTITGRFVGTNIDILPSGVYIIRRSNSTEKIIRGNVY